MKKREIKNKKNGTEDLAFNALDDKDKEILKVLKKYPEGIRQQTIIRELPNLKRRTCYNHLEKLKEKKILKHIHPIWKIWHSSDTPKILAQLKESSNSQGHHQTWLLPLVFKPSWWNKRRDRLANLKGWQFKQEVTANNNVYQQISNDYMQIQTYKNSIYFMCKKYYTNSDLETYLKAKDDVLEAIRYLEEQFRFKFLSEGNFHLVCLTPHYVTIKETLAEHFKKDGERFIMKTKEGYELRVDFSEPFGIESDNLEVKRRYLRIVKDYQDNPLLPLPSEIKKNQESTNNDLNLLIQVVKQEHEMISGLPIILNKLEKQISSHLTLIKEYRKENINWRKSKLKEIKDELKYGKQTRLKDF